MLVHDRGRLAGGDPRVNVQLRLRMCRFVCTRDRGVAMRANAWPNLGQGLLSTRASAGADYINTDATDFSACPGLSNDPISTNPAPNTSHLVGVPSGPWYAGSDPDNDPANHRPFAAHSW